MEMPKILHNPYVLGGIALVVVVTLMMGKSGTATAGADASVIASQTLSANTNIALAKVNSANQISANQYASATAIAQIGANAQSSKDYFAFLTNQGAQNAALTQVNAETNAANYQAKLRADTASVVSNNSVGIASLQAQMGITQAQILGSVTVHTSDNSVLSNQIQSDAARFISSTNSAANVTVAQINADATKHASDNASTASTIGAIASLAMMFL
jgi:hypothetical protein